MATYDLPFPARLRLPRWRREFLLNVDILGPTSPDGLAAVESVLTCFEQLAAGGAFALDQTPLGQSTLVRESSSTDDGLRCVYAVRSLHLGAYRVLLNALAQCHHHQAPIVYVDLYVKDADVEDVPIHSVLKSPFPPRSNVPFPIQAEVNLQQSREPVFRFDFTDSVDDAQIETLRPLFEAWDVLVQMGAWNDTAESMEDFGISLGETYRGGPSTIEHVCYAIRFPPEPVFDALINVAGRISQTVGRVIELTIE